MEPWIILAALAFAVFFTAMRRHDTHFIERYRGYHPVLANRNELHAVLHRKHTAIAIGYPVAIVTCVALALTGVILML